MEVIKKYKTQIYFHLFLNLAVGLFITFSSYCHLPLATVTDYGFYFLHFLTLQFSVFGILYMLSLNKYVFQIFFPILFVLFSGIAFWIYTQDIAISQGIIQVALETKADIAIDLISLPFVLYLLFSIAMVYFVMKYYTKIKGNQLFSPLTLLAIIAILVYHGAENYRYGTFTRRLPYNAIIALEEYYGKSPMMLKSIDKQLKTHVDGLNVIFILGESVRADHLHLNGYKRETTPLLSQRNDVISFPNTYTPLTYTAISVPQLLTNAGLADDYSKPKYSLIDVLNHSKIQTNWIGNQTPEKSYEVFIQQSQHHKIIDPLHSELSLQKDYDGKLLQPFKAVFKPNQNQFITLHMMGSHWWYETRYPESFRNFKPVIRSKNVTSNSPEEMVNSYDNTILYLDYFVNETIGFVERQKSNAIIIYLADHGEILGEDELWLHAQKSKASENPAMLIWCSQKFREKNPQTVILLQSNRLKKTKLDFFFSTILDLYKIQGIPYDRNKVIF